VIYLVLLLSVRFLIKRIVSIDRSVRSRPGLMPIVNHLSSPSAHARNELTP